MLWCWIKMQDFDAFSTLLVAPKVSRTQAHRKAVLQKESVSLRAGERIGVGCVKRIADVGLVVAVVL
jgi:hypothetical protein